MLKNLIIGLLYIQGFCGALSAAENAGEKEKVIQRIQDLTTAINQNKGVDFSTFWTNDVEYVKPLTGELLEGKEVITKFVQDRVKEISKRQLKFTFKPEKVTFPEPNLAVVDGVSEISDKGGLLQRNARRVELLKEKGQWYIDSISEIEVAPAPPLYGRLKGLEWLIGKWVDKDEDVTITFETNWDKFKNFIIQRFKMEVYGVVATEGLQIIGWDPIERKIRSWVYDSDGGFGSGQWSKNDNSWTAEMNYVLSDGKNASAKYEYKAVNDKSYSFSSTNRKVGGDTLPDIKPTTVVKEEK